MSTIHKNGYWEINDLSEHRYDELLNKEIVNVLKDNNVLTTLDLGCGPGAYAHFLERNGISCDCYDGNPYTPELSCGKCGILDLTVPFNLNKQFDCVISLEVGEHIPKEFEHVYINNICAHASKMIIVSWATIGQGGHGHVNEQPNEYIESLFSKKSWQRTKELENRLRTSAQLWWFKGTIMVFKGLPTSI